MRKTYKIKSRGKTIILCAAVALASAGIASPAFGEIDDQVGGGRFVLENFGMNQGWRIGMHPRQVVDVTADGKADIVGFSNQGVYVAVALEDGNFDTPKLVLADFGVDQGWQVDAHPRLVVDTNNDQFPDIVGFGKDGVYIAKSNHDGTFAPAQKVLSAFSIGQRWKVNLNPRFVADVTGDALPEIVGFGHDGVYVSVAQADGTYAAAVRVVNDFGVKQGWSTLMHPRYVQDVTGDQQADLVAFGADGVYIATGQTDGTFAPAVRAVADLGVSQGWQVGSHPRFIADVNGDGRNDLVGYGYSKVWVSLSQSDGTFTTASIGFNGMGVQQGWQVSQDPRFVADVTGDKCADLVGFGGTGVIVVPSNCDGTFAGLRKVLDQFSVNTGWQVGLHPRFVEDITGDGRADIIGFGDRGVRVAVAREDGTFS